MVLVVSNPLPLLFSRQIIFHYFIESHMTFIRIISLGASIELMLNHVQFIWIQGIRDCIMCHLQLSLNICYRNLRRFNCFQITFCIQACMSSMWCMCAISLNRSVSYVRMPWIIQWLTSCNKYLIILLIFAYVVTHLFQLPCVDTYWFVGPISTRRCSPSNPPWSGVLASGYWCIFFVCRIMSVIQQPIMLIVIISLRERRPLFAVHENVKCFFVLFLTCNYNENNFPNLRPCLGWGRTHFNPDYYVCTFDM